MMFLEFFFLSSTFHEGDGMVKKPEKEDLVKGLNKFSQKLDVVAAVIFTLIDVKGESKSTQQQPCYFCCDFCGGIISFVKTIVECYHMECSLSSMRSVCNIILTA